MKILVECYADEVLINTLLDTLRAKIKHGHNKAEIIKKLNKQPFSKFIGIIDEDPTVKPPSYLENYFQKVLIEENFIVYRHRDIKTSLIVLRPRLEEFIIRVASECRISMKNYSLPNNGDKLHSVVNLNLKLLEKLIQEVKSKGSSNFHRLKEIILSEFRWINQT